MDKNWREVLAERIEHDEDFRARFREHPGRAAASIGMPFDVFRDLWAEFAERYDAD